MSSFIERIKAKIHYGRPRKAKEKKPLTFRQLRARAKRPVKSVISMRWISTARFQKFSELCQLANTTIGEYFESIAAELLTKPTVTAIKIIKAQTNPASIERLKVTGS
jgi:hypothetical protein